jgi:hypothetical protein
VVVAWLGVGEASVPYGPELRSSGPAEGKPRVEEYGLDRLAASADAVMAGLGPLAVTLAGLAGEAERQVTLDAIEVLVVEQGRELLRRVVQRSLDVQAAAEVRAGQVTGADGEVRARAEPGHCRAVATVLGKVRVRRIAYRSGARGAGALFPRDAVLNLPEAGYSWQLQRLAGVFCLSGSYAQAQESVLAVTGVRIGRRQLEQFTARGAADAEQFYRDRPPEPAGQDGESLPPLALSADGKGVAMRPEARRETARAPGKRSRNFERRRGTGEKGHKRMAEAGCVFDVQVPAGPRTPEQVMRPDPDPRARPEAPRAVNRWYACDITAGRDVTVAKVFDEAGRRDPARRRKWIALVDGDIYQIGLVQAEAEARGAAVTILVDFIHVLEYLWKAAWCFHEPRDPAMEDWVTAQALDILHGRAPEVTARIRQLAEDQPPKGSEHAKIIRKTLHYLQAKQPYLNYPAALANGWPIATGVIEGACRHLVQDRMGITGARWGLQGAQAVLWLRAIHASGDHDAYWNYHIQQEHQRNHLSRYASSHDLAA